MTPRSIAVSTQTPLVRFGSGEDAITPNIGVHGGALLRQGEFELSPGGVSRMVLQTLRAWGDAGWLRNAHWFSLQPSAPQRIELPEYKLTVHHVQLPSQDMRAYARIKEKLWADIHGLRAPPFDTEDFRFYARYNWMTSDAVMAQAPDLDAIYVHDFQLLQVGAIVGLTAPAVLRWHVPFVPARIPSATRNFMLRLMEDFDGMVVSTRRDLQGLSNAGYRGTVLQQYPHTDLTDWPSASDEDVAEFEELAGIKPDTQVILCVARMDPVKNQDVLLRAMVRLRNRHPDVRAVLVGNGSFSASKTGGLGLDKARMWRGGLERLARELGVSDRVAFTGWIPDHLVTAAYTRATALVLPSDIEGFGLTTYEAWAYAKPPVISRGCGSAEVIQEGLTGHTFAPQDDAALAEKLDLLLSNREAAQRMGEAGRISLQNYTVQKAGPALSGFIEEAIARYARPT